ncbi:prepilin peptidase [Modestobacter sp. DSM 44400]|uniref:prepilin peptidase n=1 Tax=Modestobacter sp. DSM 44400 TaxID=1550230 RepID=UPI000B82AFEA|nr:prepilin peptidase [Modestobacter sp. DSM 44400]
MLSVLAGAVALLGLGAGELIDRLAGRFPWPAGAGVGTLLRPGASAVRRPLLPVGTALLLALVALGLGPVPELPAFLVFAVVAVLLTVVDLRHRLLPDRVVLPSLALGVVLLSAAAAGTGGWGDLARAILGAGVLFVVFLALALASPGGLGMGDVKLAALLGLHLGWLGWGAVLAGAVAGFVVQAVVALVLLAARRVRRDTELPFGPAMLVGAAVVMALALS